MSRRPELAAGASAEADWSVEERDLASQLSDGHASTFPPVFATARMIAMVELAAARVLLPLLDPGEMSVGVLVNVTHTAATPVGVTVRATARLLGMERKSYVFEVVAFDPGGEVGRGVHHRAIVDSERLLRGAQRRALPGER